MILDKCNLDITGSFMQHLDYIKLGENGRFDARPENTVLTADEPEAFGFWAEARDITVQAERGGIDAAGKPEYSGALR